MKEQLEIIYRDQWLVAINKPSGLLVHRSMLDRHETRFAVQLLRNQLGQRVSPVHRLDKPTSGVLLFALDQAVLRAVAEQFRHQQVAKTYLMVVRGWPEERGCIDYPLTDGPQKGNYAEQKGSDQPRSAITAYRSLARVELPVSDGRHPTSRYALIEARPTTGRRHQLRRHFKHIFHPLIGDTSYGDGRHNRLFRERFDSRRLLLHAEQLDFIHPINRQLIQLSAALDSEFQKLLKESGLTVSCQVKHDQPQDG